MRSFNPSSVFERSLGPRRLRPQPDAEVPHLLDLALEARDPRVALGDSLLRPATHPLEALLELRHPTLRRPQRLGVGAVHAAHEVGQHVDVAEGGVAQLVADVPVAHERPVRPRHLPLGAGVVPVGLERRRLADAADPRHLDRKSTRLNSSHYS